VRTNGEFAVTEKIGTMVIPHTINDVLMARIDRLDDNTRDLVKVASVIGRNFFYRILTEVAKAVEGIDNRLSYLKQIELIRERRRMEELEYLFKHALAQEAAYESILHQKRKEIHLQVAKTIENVFKERLHEFYGMLAIHNSKGENFENAEHYLVKAGKEALKSSASSEALHYYQNAMELYIKKHGDNVDLNMIAHLEENIALAFKNKGRFAEAVEYFDRALNSLGKSMIKTKIFLLLEVLLSSLIILKSIHFPLITKKKIPNDVDKQISKIVLYRGQALAYTDTKRMFFDTVIFVKDLFKFDPSKLTNGIEFLASSIALFAWSGVSFTISRGIIKYLEENFIFKDPKHSLHFKSYEKIYNLLIGKWFPDCDETQIEYGLKYGEIFATSFYLYFEGWINIELGNFKISEQILKKLKEISDVYNYEGARAIFFELNTKMLLKKRKNNDALRVVNECITVLNDLNQEMRTVAYLGYKVVTQILLNNNDGARDTIDECAGIVLKKGYAPAHYCSYISGVFYSNLYQLENSIRKNDRKNIPGLTKTTLKTGKEVLKRCKKVAPFRTDAYRLMGKYYWLIDKQKTAIKWWKKSMEEGERLSACPDLSRTYFEIGKSLLEPDSKYKGLNGITAEEYLEKAKTMFEEMDLQWDLDELDKVMAAR